MNDNQLDVITLCDYETCPTIKSNNEAYSMIVVKTDGDSHSIETGTGHSSGHDYESLEKRAIGGALY